MTPLLRWNSAHDRYFINMNLSSLQLPKKQLSLEHKCKLNLRIRTSERSNYMTIQQLHIFRVLASEMNYSKASEKLFMTRQAVKQNITSMETELGGPLFYNFKNHISLTPKGQLLLSESASVMESFENMMKSMYSDLRLEGTVTVGISVSLLPGFLPALREKISNFNEAFPGVSISMHDMENDEVVRKVSNGDVSIGIIMDLGNTIEGFNRYELIACKLAAMVESHHRFWDAKELTIRELSGETVQIPGMSDAFLPLFETIKKEQLDIKIEVSHHYYQVYYKVRDKGIIGLNRYFPPENDTPDCTRDILLKDASPLCASVITKKQSGISNLTAYLYPMVKALRTGYMNEPFVRDSPEKTQS